MSLLEKASSGTKNKVAPSQTHTSLFKRAMAASKSEANDSSADSPASLVIETVPVPSPVPSPAPSPFVNLSMADLKSELVALPPYPDSILAAWSILSLRLPLEAISLFFPRGDFLAPAAQVGFPSGTCDEIPVSIAPSSQNNGSLLDDEARALIAPSLGVSAVMNMSAVSMYSDSGLVGLWVYHDESLESSPDDIRFRVSELLAEASTSLPTIPMASPSPDPVPLLLAKMSKYRFATAIRYDIDSAYADRATYRGISAKAIVSAFVAASEKILEQAGAVLAYGEASFVCVLGSSSQGDAELSLFQFTKTLKRSLPFLAVETFPKGCAMSFDLTSEGLSEELARFLAI